MANVSGFLQQMLNARYGKDVRQSIHDSINAINKQLEESLHSLELYMQEAIMFRWTEIFLRKDWKASCR